MLSTRSLVTFAVSVHDNDYGDRGCLKQSSGSAASADSADLTRSLQKVLCLHRGSTAAAEISPSIHMYVLCVWLPAVTLALSRHACESSICSKCHPQQPL